MWSDNTSCILLLNNTDLMETNDPKTFRVLYHLRTKHEKVLQSASCHKYILFICWNFGNFAVLLAVTGCRLMSTSPVFYLVKDFEVKIFNSYSFELQGYKLQWQKKHYNAEYINVIFQDSKKSNIYNMQLPPLLAHNSIVKHSLRSANTHRRWQTDRRMARHCCNVTQLHSYALCHSSKVLFLLGSLLHACSLKCNNT